MHGAGGMGGGGGDWTPQRQRPWSSWTQTAAQTRVGRQRLSAWLALRFKRGQRRPLSNMNVAVTRRMLCIAVDGVYWVFG